MRYDHPDSIETQDRALSAAYSVAADLANRCRQLQDEVRTKNAWVNKDILGSVVNALMTEFWDQCFSQTEIRNTFLDALADMNRYAAGEERRP